MELNLKESIKRLIAVPTLSASYVPMLLGFICVYFIGGIEFSFSHIPWMILAVIGISAVETGKHALNELMDYNSGNDLFIDEAHMTPVAGGKKVLPAGLATKKQVWMIGIACFLLAMVIGLFITFKLSFDVLWFGLAGFFLAIVYNMEPFKISYRGLGEIFVFLAYGPVCMMGAYVMFCHENMLVPFLISLSIGFLIMNILIVNELPDYEADFKAGKMNWVARLGKEKGITLMAWVYAMHFIPLAVLSFITHNPLWMLSLITVPPMIKAVKNARANIDDIPKMLPSNFAVINIHKYVCAVMILVIFISY